MSKDPLIVSGGNSIMYAACTVIDLRKQYIKEEDPFDKDAYGKIGATVKKNHAVPDRNPFVKATYFFEFGRGIEQVVQTIEAAVAQGVIMKSGAFFKDVDEAGVPKVIDGVKQQWQGRDSYRKFCLDNPAYFAELKAKVVNSVTQMSASEIAEVEAEMALIEGSIPAEATTKDISVDEAVGIILEAEKENHEQQVKEDKKKK